MCFQSGSPVTTSPIIKTTPPKTSQMVPPPTENQMLNRLRSGGHSHWNHHHMVAGAYILLGTIASMYHGEFQRLTWKWLIGHTLSQTWETEWEEGGHSWDPGRSFPSCRLQLMLPLVPHRNAKLKGESEWTLMTQIPLVPHSHSVVYPQHNLKQFTSPISLQNKIPASTGFIILVIEPLMNSWAALEPWEPREKSFHF